MRIVLTDRGSSALQVIPDAVADVEREWARALGKARFEQLRELLVDLNRLGRAG